MPNTTLTPGQLVRHRYTDDIGTFVQTIDDCPMVDFGHPLGAETMAPSYIEPVTTHHIDSNGQPQ